MLFLGFNLTDMPTCSLNSTHYTQSAHNALSEIINNFWSARKRLHLAASYPTTKNYTNLYSFAAEQYTTSTYAYDNAGKLTSLKATPERYFFKSGNIVSKLGILTRYIYLFVYARHLSVLYEKTLSFRVFKT